MEPTEMEPGSSLHRDHGSVRRRLRSVWLGGLLAASASLLAASGSLLAASGSPPAQEPAVRPVAPSQVAPAPAPAAPPAVTVPTFPNQTCPIMGKPISSRLWLDTDYGRIWICCKGCNKKIEQHLEVSYRAAYPRVTKLVNDLCPVSGKPIPADAPAPQTVELQGHELRLCCADCLPKARAEAQVVLAKATQPKLVDVANASCPITGDPVAANAFCVIGERLVRLSSSECVEQVKKDPLAAVAKADAAAKLGSEAKASGQ